MRIKAVLRDSEILGLEPGTIERIVTTAMKNIDRVISLSSLMKVMGLGFTERTKMLDALSNQNLHIWLAKDAQQDIVFLTKEKIPEELETMGYQWQ